MGQISTQSGCDTSGSFLVSIVVYRALRINLEIRCFNLLLLSFINYLKMTEIDTSGNRLRLVFLFFFWKDEVKRENLETIQCYSNDGLSCYDEH